MGEVLYPWRPIEAAQTGNKVDVSFYGRTITQDGSLFPTSILTQGRELLFAPIRLVGEENGSPIFWEEQGCYLLNPKKERAVVNGFAQSACLIANATLDWAFDGGARWDVKIMPRGMTVPQLFGLEECPIRAWNLTRLHLEIPLKKEAAQLYVSWPAGGAAALQTGEPLPENGRIPEGGMTLPFKAGLWLGTEDVGLQLVSESDEMWQPDDRARAVEIIDAGDHWVLRLHLLDSAPRTWPEPGRDSPHINFTFGLIATPVKPIDNEYLKIRAVHIDCFAKIVGDYWPYLNGPVSGESKETVIDRLSRAGVNLLILHEKWNKIQNYWECPVTTKDEIARLVRLCHSRGIKVIPYFGYEITSPLPEFAAVRDEVTWRPEGGAENYSGWYRVPYQRALKVCYQSKWRDHLAEGILKCIDDFDFDGVYLDTTTAPFGCVNERHGCGYRDAEGTVRPTYPIFATREMMQKIYAGVHARRGIVNPHPSGATLPFITSFSDMLWDGEHIQTKIWKDGLKDFSLDYFRAEYLGRNIGIPVQFIVYEVPGVWSFDMALSLCLIHGVYPRPNAVTHPLDVMERIWNVLSLYGAADAAFTGYWEAGKKWTADREQVKVSCYEKRTLEGGKRLLAIIGNPTTAAQTGVSVSFSPEALGQREVVSAYDALLHCPVSVDQDAVALDMPALSYRIMEIVLK